MSSYECRLFFGNVTGMPLAAHRRYTMRTQAPTDSDCTIDEPDHATDRPLVGPASDAELAALAKAIAHPVRVRIFRMLARKDGRACRVIVDELPLAQSTVSEHLRILRHAGLVRANEDGVRVTYCLVPSGLKRLKALLRAI